MGSTWAILGFVVGGFLEALQFTARLRVENFSLLPRPPFILIVALIMIQ